MLWRSSSSLPTTLALPFTAHGVVEAGDEENQADVGAGLDVLVGLEQLVAGHVGEQQAAVVNDLDEARLAALGRGVAAAVGVGGGHDHEGSVADELLHPRSEMALELLHRPLRGGAKLTVEPAVADGCFVSDGCHSACSFMSDSYPVILAAPAGAGNASARMNQGLLWRVTALTAAATDSIIEVPAEVAQVVEHGTENAGVDSSSLSLGTTVSFLIVFSFIGVSLTALKPRIL